MYEIYPISRMLEILFGLADGRLPAVVDFDYLQGMHLSVDDARHLVAAGLLSPGPPPTELLCSECGEYTEIVYIDDYKGKFFPVLPCTENVGSRVDPERMQTWQLTLSQIAEAVFKPLGLTATPEELEPNRLWRLGRRAWAGVSWTVYFARELRRRDAMRLLSGIRAPARSVVLVSKYLPIEPPEPKTPLILRLVDFVSYEAEALCVDVAHVAEQLMLRLAEEAKMPAPKRQPRRGPRSAHIESLTRALEEHLRSARDYAFERLDRTGAAELPPRPTMDFLARKLGVDKATVSRCLNDKRAGELRLLWELAADPDRLLAAAMRGH
ncbi:MAG: hypothetical protein DCC68_23235 [Planctomycetota bacterium]|nr:MAG: hypothetical protein DCC68_23235 [Planctomycetota bacterium]